MRVLVAGWFSFENAHATVGDVLARDLVCEWLTAASYPYDVALAPPFQGGIDLRRADPGAYSHAVFVCGPFEQKAMEAEFLGRFASSVVIGVNLTMVAPREDWNPFDVLIERDSSLAARPDLVFMSRQPLVPVVGRCLVEPYPGALDATANAAIDRLLRSREVAVVEIDTRLDVNTTGLRTAAEIESLIARMDLVVTTRLHGMVFSLKNGVPVIAIDPEAGGAKIVRQATTIDWPAAFVVDAVTDEALQHAFDYCLTEKARGRARECSRWAATRVAQVRREFIDAFQESDRPDRSSRKRREREAFAASWLRARR